MEIESEFVKKTWGWELWFDNSELYCGKLLFIEHGKWSSKGKYHYHKKKTESFFVIEGQLQLDFIDENGRSNTKVLAPMHTFRLNIGVKHRFTSISKTGCKFIEVSTFHSDDDSYRGRLDVETGDWIEYGA